jgi:hypothetical protein
MKRLSSELSFNTSSPINSDTTGDFSGLGALGNMFGGMMNNMMNPPIDQNLIEGEAVVTDGETPVIEATEVEEEVATPTFDENDFIIDFIAPFQISLEDYTEAGKYQALNTFLATNKNGKVFTISTLYLVENENEKEFINSIPYNSSNVFSSTPITSNILINTLDNYISNFEFEYIDDEDINKFRIKTKKINDDKSFSDEEYIFKMTSDVFSSINYIDTYVFDMVVNNHDLGVASIIGKSVDNPTPIVIVDSVEKIVAMAQMKKDSTCSGVEFTIKDNNGEKNTILAIFDFGKMPKKKYKGMTLEKLQKLYLQEADQYFQIYSNFCMFSNIDKNYFIIRAKNKDFQTKLFLLDSTIRTELETMIGEY